MAPLAHRPVAQQRRPFAQPRLSTIERSTQAVRVERLRAVGPVRLGRLGGKESLVLVVIIVIVIFVQVFSGLGSVTHDESVMMELTKWP